MITINDYIKWYDNEKRKMLDSGHFRSEPTFLFKYDEYSDEWIFNPDNWNGGDILRRATINLNKANEYYEIKYYRIDDQTTIFIFSSTSWYEISWYKNRGRTDIIKMNGEPIYLEDYINLCNSLNITLN